MRRTLLFCQYHNTDLFPTTVRLARFFADEGWHVHILCTMDSPTLIADYGPGVSLQRLPLRAGRAAGPRNYAAFAAHAIAAARRHSPAFTYGFDVHGLVAAAAAAKATGVFFVYHLYDLAVPEEGSGRFDRLFLPLERPLLERAAAMVVASRGKARYFVSRGVTRPILVMANSPPLQPRGKTSRLKEVLAERGISANTIVYHHGSMGWGKGLREVVASMPAWPEDSVLVLVGVAHRQGFVEQLLNDAQEHGVGGRVVFLGVVPLPELFELTRSADLGLYTPTTLDAIHTTSGEAAVKLNDYLACGVPAIVSNLPVLVDFVRETQAGAAVDVRDTRAVGHLIGRLLRDPEARAKMADAAYRAHVTTYNLRKQVQPLLDAVPELARASAAAAWSRRSGHAVQDGPTS